MKFKALTLLMFLSMNVFADTTEDLRMFRENLIREGQLTQHSIDSMEEIRAQYNDYLIDQTSLSEGSRKIAVTAGFVSIFLAPFTSILSAKLVSLASGFSSVIGVTKFSLNSKEELQELKRNISRTAHEASMVAYHFNIKADIAEYKNTLSELDQISYSIAAQSAAQLNAWDKKIDVAGSLGVSQIELSIATINSLQSIANNKYWLIQNIIQEIEARL